MANDSKGIKIPAILVPGTDNPILIKSENVQVDEDFTLAEWVNSNSKGGYKMTYENGVLKIKVNN